MENITKKSLLERYGIAIHHLDFKYIKDCNDGKEMEKIVHILRSNEEGYYPDLTRCAEEKLKELKPQSRLFRVEEQIKGREALDPKELQPIYDWNQEIKITDKKLKKLVEDTNVQNVNDPHIPPIRKGGNILQIQDVKPDIKEKPKFERIKSTDYNKWDKYDPEEEMLRIDLQEERQQEEVERKNRLNMKKLKKEPLTITEIKDDDLQNSDKWSNLSEIEKDKLSEEYRLRGNEYFRAKEYDLALKEYSCAIQCCPEKAVAAYNNRALTHFKQQNFVDSIKDSEASLKIEPSNLKARLRLAEASYCYGKRRESYQLYINVLKIDPENSVALRAITELRKQFEDLPPPNATRVQIQEEPTNNKTATEPVKAPKSQQQPQPQHQPQPKSKPKSINYDLADLIKPNRVVPNKLVKAAESLGKNMTKADNKNKQQERSNTKDNRKEELCLPGNSETKMFKKLIEEL